jgi:hypothetical protein
MAISLFEFLFEKPSGTFLTAPPRLHNLVAIGACFHLPTGAVTGSPPLFHPVRELFVRASLLELPQVSLVLLIKSLRCVHWNPPVICNVTRYSSTACLFHLCARQRKLALNLATVKTIGELYVVPAADPQTTRHVTVLMAACEVHAAHIRTMCEDASEAKARTTLTYSHHGIVDPENWTTS